jgi:hypothetical protein
MIEVGRSIWMPASIPFTGVLNETQSGQTSDAQQDTDILGGATALTGATVKVRDVSGKYQLASESVHIYTLFGKRDSARPIYYWPRPLPLDFRGQLEIDAVNAGTEAAGHVVFIGLPRAERDMRIDETQQQGYPATVPVDMGFGAVANEVTNKRTAKLDRDFLVYGAFTNSASAQLRAMGVDGRLWTSDYPPVWAVAGRAAAEQPVLFWPRPYLIPKGSTVAFDFKNIDAEAAGTKLTLVGHKL